MNKLSTASFVGLCSFRARGDDNNYYWQSREAPNPGQTVVIACDQPLFALAKTIQWAQKDSAGEDNLVVILVGSRRRLRWLTRVFSEERAPCFNLSKNAKRGFRLDCLLL